MNKQGFSLVEILVAIGIMGIIAVGVARFTRNFERSQARANARAHSKKINKRLLKFVQRDMKFQTDFTVEDDGLTLSVTRRKTFDQNDTDAVYTVRFVTRCVDIPAAISNPLETKIFNVDSIRDKIFDSENACFEKLVDLCDNNQYPQVFIDYDTTDDRIPAYRPNLVPDFSGNFAQKTLRQGTLGTAICFGEAGNKLQVVANSIFLTGSVNKQEKVGIISDQVLLTTDNIAGVTLLPNE